MPVVGMRARLFSFQGPPLPSRKWRIFDGYDTHTVDSTQIPTVPFAMVDEHVYAAIRGCSVKSVQRERRQGVGCRYFKVNATQIRYRVSDIFEFLEAQPSGGGRQAVER